MSCAYCMSNANCRLCIKCDRIYCKEHISAHLGNFMCDDCEGIFCAGARYRSWCFKCYASRCADIMAECGLDEIEEKINDLWF